MEREKVIVRTGVIGIAANLLLSGFKAAVGLISGSVAILLDAVNNLTDAISSLVTVAGAKLSGKAPDKKHPLGHGRAEYLSAMIVAVIVLYAGVTALVESIKKIVHPEDVNYGTAALVIVSAAIVVKIVLGLYFRLMGKKADSDALKASGADALFDAVISASTLLAAVLYLTLGWRLEAYLAALISLVIIRSGVGMLRGTVSQILGERIDRSVTEAVRAAVLDFPEVGGVHDLILHSYGPTMLIGSLHIEVPDGMTAAELDTLERDIAHAVYRKTQVVITGILVITGISVYAANTGDAGINAMQDAVRRLADENRAVLQIHGFYVNKQEKTLTFDAVLDFDVPDRDAAAAELKTAVEALYPDYKVHMTLDSDISD